MLVSGSPSGTLNFSDAGGWDGAGFVSAIKFAQSGAWVARNDCDNAHLFYPGDKKARHVFQLGLNYSATYGSSPRAYNDINFLQMCYDADICWLNDQIAYFISMGFVWKTTDGGKTIAITNFNGGVKDRTLFLDNLQSKEQRGGGQHIAIDPADATGNTVALGHPVDGVYTTIDGGANWTLKTGLATPTTLSGSASDNTTANDNVGISVAYDLSSGTTSGRTNRVAICISGRGTYTTSATLTGAFTLTTSGPIGVNQLAWANGKLYAAGTGNGDALLKVYSGGSWSTVTGNLLAIAVTAHPTSFDTVAAVSQGGANHLTTNNSTWTTTDNFFNKWIANDVPYIGYRWTTTDVHVGLGAGFASWDPSKTARLYVATGMGVFWNDNFPADNSKPWTSQTLGIKQLIPLYAHTSANGTKTVCVLDRGTLTATEATIGRQAVKHGPSLDGGHDNNGLQDCGSADTFADNPLHWVIARAKRGGGTPAGLQSYDDMQTDAVGFPTQPSGMYGGNIQGGNNGHVVWASSNNGPLQTSEDGGNTWDTPTLNGVSSAGMGFHGNMFQRREILKIDKTNTNRVWLYWNGTSSANKGLYRATDKGHAFNRISNPFTDSDAYSNKLRLSPVDHTHLLWVRGLIDGYPTAPAANGLYICTDDGQSFAALTGWYSPEDAVFGAPAPGKSYSTLYVLGWRMVAATLTYGVWACYNLDPLQPGTSNGSVNTWQLVASSPLGYPLEGALLLAHPTLFGRVDIAMAQGGLLTGSYGTKLLQT